MDLGGTNEPSDESTPMLCDVDLSLVPQGYFYESEAALNDLIYAKYTNAYSYHVMFAYFDRQNVALKGLAMFFKKSSHEELEHVEFQNMRIRQVKLQQMPVPSVEYEHAKKEMHYMAAGQANDTLMAKFIESKFLGKQEERIKKVVGYVAQLTRVGKGHGVWYFDQMLLGVGMAV